MSDDGAPNAQKPAECFSQFYQNQRFNAKMERAKGIEPSYAAWEAAVLPLNYARQGPRTGRAA